MPVELWQAKAVRYSRLRWIGVAFFCLAVPNLVAAIAAVATDRASGGLIAISLFATGLSLGSFGTNDDAALHAMSDLARRDALPANLAAEYAAERKKRPAIHITMALSKPCCAACSLCCVRHLRACTGNSMKPSTPRSAA
jgi:hypothetical protein